MPLVLELITHRFRGRPWRLALNPVACCIGITSQSEQVLTKKTHDERKRCDHQEEHCAEYDRIDDECHQ